MKAATIPKSKAKTAYSLLSEVRTLILAEPKRYDQTTYIARPDGLGESYEFTSRGFPSCGTVGCVAGWVATLKGPRLFSYGAAGGIAASILGLGDAQYYELFGGGMVKGNAQTRAHAKSGAAHIAAFQKKYRAQLLAKKL